MLSRDLRLYNISYSATIMGIAQGMFGVDLITSLTDAWIDDGERSSISKMPV
jgi:hypothetical protein